MSKIKYLHNDFRKVAEISGERLKLIITPSQARTFPKLCKYNARLRGAFCALHNAAKPLISLNTVFSTMDIITQRYGKSANAQQEHNGA